ncbi:MAG: divergent polysaccharide deacetylase family protein [Pseudomonadota bacterium]
MTALRCIGALATVAGAAALAAAPTADAAEQDSTPSIAIIIDDLGYRAALDARILELPPEIAVAVLPNAPNTRRVAETAARQSRDVLVHLPMQALGPGGLAHYAPVALRADVTRDELERVVAHALAAVPEARGINNHMGSLLTRQHEPMRWLMQTLACHRDLYFIDSYTTAESVAHRMAQEALVPTARRDVFLDDSHDEADIRAQFKRLVRLAHERGAALAIGHPQPETLAVLESELALLEQHGVELVPATALLEGVSAPERAATVLAGTRTAP